MGNLKKIISLHQASQISGYHQDYLSSLIRKKEIKGEKLGSNWFTTEEEIKNYIFKQKIRNKNIIVKYILWFTKANSSLIYAFAFLAIFSVGVYFFNKQFSGVQAETAKKEIPSTTQNELLVKRDPLKELQF